MSHLPRLVLVLTIKLSVNRLVVANNIFVIVVVVVSVIAAGSEDVIAG